jgi:hypothetical protein
MLFTGAPIYKNMSIAVLGRISPVWLRPNRERAIGERHVTDLGIRPPGSSGRCARSRAATSRRWAWPSG